MNKGERKREAASHDNEMLDSLLSLSNQAYCTEDNYDNSDGRSKGPDSSRFPRPYDSRLHPCIIAIPSNAMTLRRPIMTIHHAAQIQHYFLQHHICLEKPYPQCMRSGRHGPEISRVVPCTVGNGLAPANGDIRLFLVGNGVAALRRKIVDFGHVCEGQREVDVMGWCEDEGYIEGPLARVVFCFEGELARGFDEAGGEVGGERGFCSL